MAIEGRACILFASRPPHQVPMTAPPASATWQSSPASLPQSPTTTSAPAAGGSPSGASRWVEEPAAGVSCIRRRPPVRSAWSTSRRGCCSRGSSVRMSRPPRRSARMLVAARGIGGGGRSLAFFSVDGTAWCSSAGASSSSSAACWWPSCWSISGSPVSEPRLSVHAPSASFHRHPPLLNHAARRSISECRARPPLGV
jgi:hypothetical protein